MKSFPRAITRDEGCHVNISIARVHAFRSGPDIRSDIVDT